MANGFSTPSRWSRQDVLSLLQLLAMIVVPIIVATLPVLIQQHYSKLSIHFYIYQSALNVTLTFA